MKYELFIPLCTSAMASEWEPVSGYSNLIQNIFNKFTCEEYNSQLMYNGNIIASEESLSDLPIDINNLSSGKGTIQQSDVCQDNNEKIKKA